MTEFTIVYIKQGEYLTTNNSDVVCSAILGSCVSACIFDPIKMVGGMNHFLLPDTDDLSNSGSHRFGAQSMEVMINEILKLGAHREHLKAKVFGGANVTKNKSNIGAQNAAFVLEYLDREGIECVARSLGKNQARRVKFYPSTGKALLKYLDAVDTPLAALDQTTSEPVSQGDVTLF